MMWVNDTLPPRARRRWLLITMRLSKSSLTGTARTLVAVGRARLDSMLVAVRAGAPRSRSWVTFRASSAGAAEEPASFFAGFFASFAAGAACLASAFPPLPPAPEAGSASVPAGAPLAAPLADPDLGSAKKLHHALSTEFGSFRYF